ncbi:MAG: ABC transporter ATP-binding protein [Candidatus Woesearchaeota archaeon]
MNKLVVRDCVFKQGSFQLKHINLTLTSGDILGLMGLSGAGKSTFIKGLIGELSLTSGTVSLIKNNKSFQLRTNVGYSPQQNSLYSHLTVEENILLFGRLLSVNKSALKRRMNWLLSRLDLNGARHKRVTQLSGGMAKRVDIVVSLIHNPDVVIFDEPFNGIDVSLQLFVWDIISYLSKEGKIVIISSHLLSDLAKHCSQLGLVHEGTFYDDFRIRLSLKESGLHNLESFLHALFLGNRGLA